MPMPIDNFNSLVPELYVADYEKSYHFYVDVLGFTFWYGRENPRFSVLTYGDAQIMIQQEEPSDWHTGALEYPYGRGINFQIRTKDIEGLVARLEEHNYPIRRGIKESWRHVIGDVLIGEKEIHVLDPDGYFLRFSQKIGQKPLESYFVE